jgi:uncharacterized SAM-binding protein YcdF (DUF218 family)
MFESIARLILNLVMPLNLVFILFGVGGILLLVKWYRGALVAVAGAVIILLISLTPYLPDLVTASLQDRYDVFRPEENPDWLGVPGETQPDTVTYPAVHILVLGGGHNPDLWLPPANRLSARALGRLTEGIRLHNQIPGSLLIFSGWSSSGGQSVAEVMGLAAIDLGVDEDRIRLLTRPNDTCREAQEYYLNFGSGTPLILVTSATHMPRAMQLFRQTGLNPYPAPANHQLKFHPDRRRYFHRLDPVNITRLQGGIKEYVGMIWGRMECRLPDDLQESNGVNGANG